MIDKKNIEKLIAKYDKQFQDNYNAYQETGMTRYSTAYHKAEDLADALRAALRAEDNRAELGSLKASISQWRSTIDRMGASPNPEEVKRLLAEISCTARLHRI